MAAKEASNPVNVARPVQVMPRIIGKQQKNTKNYELLNTGKEHFHE